MWPVLETLHPFSSWFLIRVLMFYYWVISSVQFSHSVVSDSLWPHGLQHPRPPCPSPIPGGYSNSRPSCQWGHPTISCYVVPFSSCLQSSPASRSFPVSQFFPSGGQGIGVSASASVLSHEYSGLISSRMDWLDLLAVQGTLKSLLQHHSSKASVLWCSAFFTVQLSHPYVTTGKTKALTRRAFVGHIHVLIYSVRWNDVLQLKGVNAWSFSFSPSLNKCLLFSRR